MTLNAIVNMVLRRLLRRAVNMGINASIKAASNRGQAARRDVAREDTASGIPRLKQRRRPK
ncbi:hypothetical protein AB9K35_05075 [Leisingera sp. XS_AS12]|uniref:hypothetical protein n=1 Tax=Leisingera sp. XS_AS12 TaxID=3241294 RepID=UPI0035186819